MSLSKASARGRGISVLRALAELEIALIDDDEEYLRFELPFSKELVFDVNSLATLKKELSADEVVISLYPGKHDHLLGIYFKKEVAR